MVYSSYLGRFQNFQAVFKWLEKKPKQLQNQKPISGQILCPGGLKVIIATYPCLNQGQLFPPSMILIWVAWRRSVQALHCHNQFSFFDCFIGRY